MKKFLVSVAAVGFTTMAMAQAVDFATADADLSGDVSLTEAQILWPELTEEGFAAADTDASGSLSQEEFDAYAAANPVAPAM